MIIWLASYPKSGNTYLRSFLCGYYFSKNGKFEFNQLKNIDQYPDKKFFDMTHKSSVNLGASEEKSHLTLLCPTPLTRLPTKKK